VIRLALLLLMLPSLALAQAQVALGGLSVDQSAQVEVTADTLSVDQASRRAVFSGNVVVGQGTMRVSAGTVEVTYADETGEITQLLLSGGVTFVTDTEQAEAGSAEYDLTSGLLVLTGDVLLTQGASAIAADRMTINLRDGTAQMDGRVRTVFGQGE